MSIRIIQVTFACLLCLWSHAARAEVAYDPEYYASLVSLGLPEEAFQYAVTWTGAGDASAARAVAYALLEGQGVSKEPLKAMKFACGSAAIEELDKSKVLIKGNMVLVGQLAEPYRCPSADGVQQ